MFQGDRVSVWNDEKVLETKGANGFTTLNVLKAAELYTQKMVKMATFMLWLFYHNNNV